MGIVCDMHSIFTTYNMKAFYTFLLNIQVLPLFWPFPCVDCTFKQTMWWKLHFAAPVLKLLTNCLVNNNNFHVQQKSAKCLCIKVAISGCQFLQRHGGKSTNWPVNLVIGNIMWQPHKIEVQSYAIVVFLCNICNIMLQ